METDKENYYRDTQQQLFAHNFMQEAVQKIDPFKAEDGTGIMGRMRDVLTKKGLSVGAYSLNTHSIATVGKPGVTETPMIISGSGVTRFNPAPSYPDFDATIGLLNGDTTPASGVFGDWYSDTFVQSISRNQLLYDTLSEMETIVKFPTSGIGRQLSMVSKMIDSRHTRGSDADFFFTSTGGWDTHSALIMNQERLFADIDASFGAFAREMKAKEVWDSVTLIQVSDFARTNNPNGNAGSDHAWGGNYIMMGGGVKGGQIAGKYPSLKDGAPLNIGRGRMIPEQSWESVFQPIAQWAGIEEEADLDFILPNRGNFNADHFFPVEDLFEPTPTLSPTGSPTPEPTTSQPTNAPTTSAPTTAQPTTNSTTDTL